MNFTFGTGDVTAGNLGSQIAERLESLGHQVTVFAMSSSAEKWKRAGFTLTPIEMAEEFFQNTRPDALISGLSSPKMGGAEFEMRVVELARSHSVPLVFLDDDWRSFKRHDVVPDLYLTLDELGKKLIEETYPHASVALMGDDAAGVTPSSELIREIEKLKQDGKTVVLLYVTKDPRTKGVVELALACLAMSRDTVIIPRFHPGAPEDFKLWCKEKVEPQGEMIVEMAGHPADHIAALADVTMGAAGTGMRVSCYNDKIPAFVWDEAISATLREETGEEHSTLVTAKVAIEIQEAVSFQTILEMNREFAPKRHELFKNPVPFSSEKAVQAIIDLVRRG